MTFNLVHFVLTSDQKETAKGGDDYRDVRGPMLGARIEDLMCCVVVMQVEDRSHSEFKGNDVYDRVHCTFQPVHNSDVFHRFTA
jgi:hypothetical protein